MLSELSEGFWVEPVVCEDPGLSDFKSSLFFNDFVGELRWNTFYFRLELIQNVLWLWYNGYLYEIDSSLCSANGYWDSLLRTACGYWQPWNFAFRIEWFDDRILLYVEMLGKRY